MALPDCVATVLAVGGLPAVLFVLIRFGPDAILRLLAGIVALVGDDKHWQRFLDLLRTLRSRDQRPPSLPSGSGES